MKDKIDFGEFGVLTWNEAFDNMELSVDDLLSFAETDEEFETIYILLAVMDVDYHNICSCE